MTDLPALISRYAERFATLGGGTHHISSPLGAWLVLALVAPAAEGDDQQQLLDALGTDARSAQRAAAELLAEPHPAVVAAAAAWTDPSSARLIQWSGSLPKTVETGAIPSQAAADDWAREKTLGLIERFPVELRELVVVLASALATRISWSIPFEFADASELRGPWSRELDRVLHAGPSYAHHTAIVDTDRAGLVGIHTAQGEDLAVTSVIADESVPPADVLAAAHEIATSDVAEVSLFDLPQGEHPLWTITEEESTWSGEHLEAVLPAWSARSQHQLLDLPQLGFGAAGRTLQHLAGDGGPVEAIQSAVARFHREGFEAAALTVAAVAAGVPMARPGPYRTGVVRFSHPYAVVATALAGEDDRWDGLPVFAAWVAEPENAQD
ncbi:hypothetical protein G9U51_10270 [Calidifontibacter sp. DB0510]|uniref:Serpin domain-containing protein n=1 Tax=Metallococcus carri TaxID=1656884 RepID=A0A967E9A4_9MICO|nr:hypothetical protein [Metallococcus carri]NHN56162.1 hypothetical protein [Metallococcus carri]NOP38787.1 hypothetical protein [Calidifontibacter sp. DB2511S]